MAEDREAAIQAALETNDALEKVQRLRPRWEDYVAEGVLPGDPRSGDAETSAKVEGHDRVVRMLQMNEAANAKAGELGDEAHSKRRTEKIRGPDGLPRYVRADRAEMLERKFHRRRDRRASITVPALPWKDEQ